jgi:hypothetical protein
LHISFISFYCLIDFPKNSSPIFNKRGESGHPCLVHDFRGGCFSFFLLSMIEATCISFIVFFMLKYNLSIPSLFGAFKMKGCWIFWKTFFCIYWGDHIIFVLYSVCVSHSIYWFAYAELSWHPWNEINSIMVYNLLDMLFY